MKLSILQGKDIIDIRTGEKIGKIIDAEIEIKSGKIINIYIERKKLKNFFSSEKVRNIKFEQIKKIGEDVILIDLLE